MSFSSFSQIRRICKSLSFAIIRRAEATCCIGTCTSCQTTYFTFDEPFGALDAKVRKELRRWLRKLHDEVHITSVFVTHDQEEALDVADQIVVMNEGEIEQQGTPDEVYDHPCKSVCV